MKSHFDLYYNNISTLTLDAKCKILNNNIYKHGGPTSSCKNTCEIEVQDSV